MKVLIDDFDDLCVDSFEFDFKELSLSCYGTLRIRDRYIDSTGYWSKKEYSSDGSKLTYKDSNGYFEKITYDSYGNCTTYSDGTGVTY